SVKVMVIGDLMLDEYLWGRVERISPEAPVPVVEIESESIGLGGAANVAHNISALGAVAIPVGVIGQDPAGEKLLMEMNRLGITTQGIVVDPSRQTTLKTRVIAHHQHVVRTDRETKRPISQDMARRIVNFVKEGIDQVDALLLEDYNKGVITKQLLGQVIPLAVERGKLCTADPKFDNFFDFKGVTVFKPNLREVEAAFGIRIGPKEDLPALGRKLLQRLGCKYVLFTQGADGMSLFEGDGVVSHVPAVAREVFDVSGAGDTVIATLTVAMAAGAEIMEAVELANHAAGMVVGQVGVVPVTKEMIEESLTRS
ncbi:MAG TPA: D-glycero-beta-D-manno-heptose-7-phosphate kinase, partial [Candidatus Latescibacteria bacterium]|nr:D-glycero-beta-D-manno-heptose-7-phosphate kinase [Candidatus Latescibacterota bacterium]